MAAKKAAKAAAKKPAAGKKADPVDPRVAALARALGNLAAELKATAPTSLADECDAVVAAAAAFD